MGGEPFTESTQICNTALGQIERKAGLARAYLAAPPGRRLSVT